MELKPGYKQTKVGVIPEEWEVKKLSEITTIATGNTPPTKDSTNYGDEHLFVSPGDLGERKYIVDTEKKLSKKGFVISRRFPSPSVLFTCIGSTIGKCGISTMELTSNQQINALFPANCVSTEFLYYELSRTALRIKALASEQAVPIVNKSQFGDTAIVFPSLTEQRVIAGARSDVDALIGAMDKLIAKKRDLKQAAMEQLLTGRRRLPGFKGEWGLVSLGELFTFKNGLNKGKEFFGRGTPIVNYMDVYGHPGLFKNDLHGRVSLSSQERKTFEVKEGDVFFTRTSETVEETGIAAVMLDDPEETVFSGFLLRARPKDNSLSDSFKKYCFASRPVRSQIVSRASYTTRALTNGRLLSLVKLQRPPLAEQTAIANVLSDMDAEIVALKQKRDKTHALKKGMMQELLTGKTRLV